MSLTSSISTGLANKKLVSRLNRVESFYSNELTAWHFFTRSKEGLSPLEFRLENGLIRRYDGTNVSYATGSEAGQFCGMTRFGRAGYRTCLFEKPAGRGGIIITYSDTDSPNHSVIRGKVASNFDGSWKIELPPGNEVSAASGERFDFFKSAFLNSGEGLLFGLHPIPSLAFYPWRNRTFTASALSTNNFTTGPFALAVNSRGRYLALANKGDGSALHAWEGTPGNWAEYDIPSENLLPAGVGGGLGGVLFLQVDFLANGNIHLFLGIDPFRIFACRIGGNWAVPKTFDSVSITGFTTYDTLVDSAFKTHLFLFQQPSDVNPQFAGVKYLVLDSASHQILSTEAVAFPELRAGPVYHYANRPRIALDPRTNTPHFLFWQKVNPPELRLSRKEGSQFPSESVYTSTIGTPLFHSKALALDFEGTIYVAYLVKSGTLVASSPSHDWFFEQPGKPDDHASLFLATKRNGVWTTETIDNSGTVEFVHDIFVVPP